MKQFNDKEYKLIMSHISYIKGHLKAIERITNEIIPINDFEIATGQEMAKDGEYTQSPCLECKDVYKMCHLRCDKITSPWNPTIKTIPLIDGHVRIHCQTCGNIKKAVTKIKDGYYCQGCQNDLMPDDIQPGEAVKRKFCFSCGSRLDGFYKVDDMEELICEKCDVMDGRR